MVEDLYPHAVVWTSPERVGAIDQIFQHMGQAVRLVGVGGQRLAEIDALARRWDCPHEDDLRKLLIDHPSPYVFLGSIAGVRRDDLLTAVSSGARVLSMEPLASEFDELINPKPKARSVSTPVTAYASMSADRGAGLSTITSSQASASQRPEQGCARWVPPFQSARGWASVTEPEQALGQRQMISFDSFGPPDEASLFARLFDAWQTVLSLTDVPDEIDASLVGPLGESPENLRGMTGHLCAHGRVGDGCAVVLRLSDHAGWQGRTLNTIGSEGHLRVSDRGYELYDADGTCLDRLSDDGKTAPFTQLIAEYWKCLLTATPATTTSPQPDTATLREPAILACCQACLLSSRTGQPESPVKLLQLHGY